MDTLLVSIWWMEHYGYIWRICWELSRCIRQTYGSNRALSTFVTLLIMIFWVWPPLRLCQTPEWEVSLFMHRYNPFPFPVLLYNSTQQQIWCTRVRLDDNPCGVYNIGCFGVSSPLKWSWHHQLGCNLNTACTFEWHMPECTAPGVSQNIIL